MLEYSKLSERGLLSWQGPTGSIPVSHRGIGFTKRSIDLTEHLPVIDEQLLNNGSPELTREILTLLSIELPKMQMSIHDAFEEQDLTAVHNQLHRLIGSCTYCGLARLKKVALELDQARQQPLEQNLLDQFNTEVETVMIALKDKGFCEN